MKLLFSKIKSGAKVLLISAAIAVICWGALQLFWPQIKWAIELDLAGVFATVDLSLSGAWKTAQGIYGPFLALCVEMGILFLAVWGLYRKRNGVRFKCPFAWEKNEQGLLQPKLLHKTGVDFLFDRLAPFIMAVELSRMSMGQLAKEAPALLVVCVAPLLLQQLRIIKFRPTQASKAGDFPLSGFAQGTMHPSSVFVMYLMSMFTVQDPMGAMSVFVKAMAVESLVAQVLATYNLSRFGSKPENVFWALVKNPNLIGTWIGIGLAIGKFPISDKNPLLAKAWNSQLGLDGLNCSWIYEKFICHFIYGKLGLVLLVTAVFMAIAGEIKGGGSFKTFIWGQDWRLIRTATFEKMVCMTAFVVLFGYPIAHLPGVRDLILVNAMYYAMTSSPFGYSMTERMEGHKVIHAKIIAFQLMMAPILCPLWALLIKAIF